MSIDLDLEELKELRNLTLGKTWIIENNRLSIYDFQMPFLNSIIEKLTNAINEKAKNKETHQ